MDSRNGPSAHAPVGPAGSGDAALPASAKTGGLLLMGSDGHPIKTVELSKSASQESLCSLPEGLGKRTAVDSSQMVVAHPTPDVGAVGHVFFTWMDNIIQLGFKRNKDGANLEHQDLWELQHDLRAEQVVQHFELYWAEEQAAAIAAGKKANLSNVFWKLTKPWILASAGFELLRLVAQYTAPMVIREIIYYIQRPVQDSRDGILLIVLLLLSSAFVALGKSHAFHKALSAGLVTKAACNSLVYRKVLKLSPSARQKYSSGNIVNLMATDSERMFQSFMSVNALWAAPLGLIVSLAMMYSSVKNATWFCLIALFAVFFMLAFIFMRISTLERLRLEAADVRVKVLNEMMQGIKVIKLMGWEQPIQQTCDKSRESELIHVRGIAVTKALMIAVVLGSSVLAAVVTFSVYVALYPDEGMSPENIFVAAILINMLRFPLMQIPEALSAYARIKESFRRMQELLESEDIEPVALLEGHGGQMGDTVMSITNGKFVWELEKTPEQLAEEAKKKEVEKKKKEVEKKKQAREDAKKKKQVKADGESASNTGASKSAELAEVDEDKPYVWGGPTLENINLDIKKGELVMVTGRVGSGKSSLLNALLGEINKLEGQVRACAHACKHACSIVFTCAGHVCSAMHWNDGHHALSLTPKP
jgi:ABC-type multidrug transport system fused ATPase/permease subunit